MKIGLYGYGKMGKLIHQLAEEQGHEIVGIINSQTNKNKIEQYIHAADIIIEFSRPKSAYINILNCLELATPVVSGTTGFNEQLLELAKKANQYETGFFHSPNFSIGMYLFKRINATLAKYMNSFPDYEVSMLEQHHKYKLDSPSGTAVDLANDIIEQMDRKSAWTLQSDGAKENLFIESEREGEIIGTHKVLYNSEVDHIALEHKAITRFGFAHGAITAAEWLLQRKGYYGMKDLINHLLSE